MSAKILIVEDEIPLAEILQYNLEAEGFYVRHAETGTDAGLLIREEYPDLIILDWVLPQLSGIEICRRLRSTPATRAIPILMLTARDEERDRIRGFSTGADDYVTKPFSLLELMARVKAILRRTAPELVSETLSFGGLELNRTTQCVTRGVSKIHISPAEFRLLEFFMENHGRVLSRQQLSDGVWGRDTYINERTVDVHVGRLRKSIVNGEDYDPIRTVRGVGYCFCQYPGLNHP